MRSIIRHLFLSVAGLCLLASCSNTERASRPPADSTGGPGAMRDRRDAVQCKDPGDRPGLATEWGERTKDRVNSAIFSRKSGRPMEVAKIFYNDTQGAAAMTGNMRDYTNSFRDYGGGIFRLGMRNQRGGALSAFMKNGDLVCLGEKGERYSVEVENLSNHRLECVVSVDGLDVISGRGASVRNRGYVLDPGERREIRGWRTSLQEVASFRFGGVGQSYAENKHGDTRNVGVVGCAIFAEKGTDPQPYRGTDTWRRLHADPFIARPDTGFATPLH